MLSNKRIAVTTLYPLTFIVLSFISENDNNLRPLGNDVMFALEKPDEPSSSSSSSRARSAANPSAGGDRVDEKDDCVKTEADNDGRPTAEYGPDDYYGNAVDCYMWKRDVEVSRTCGF